MSAPRIQKSANNEARRKVERKIRAQARIRKAIGKDPAGERAQRKEVKSLDKLTKEVEIQSISHISFEGDNAFEQELWLCNQLPGAM